MSEYICTADVEREGRGSLATSNLRECRVIGVGKTPAGSKIHNLEVLGMKHWTKRSWSFKSG